MKKKLLLVVLALAILTSLTAGTLAVYTRTVVDTEKVEAKRFAFNAAGNIVGSSTSINLAPKEKMEYEFSIANVGENSTAIAEVPLKFDVTIDYKAAAEAMPGLTAELFDSEGKSLGEYTTGVIKYTAESQAGVNFLQEYKVVITWKDNGNSNAGQTAAGTEKVSFSSGLTLTVVATQVIPTT